MQQISQLQPKKPKTTFLATKSDISAVASLEDVPLNVDSQASMLLSCPWLPGVTPSRSGMLLLEATKYEHRLSMVVDLHPTAAAVNSSAAVADLPVAGKDVSLAVVDAQAADAGAPLAAAAAYSAIEGPFLSLVTPVGTFSASDSRSVAAAETPLDSA